MVKIFVTGDNHIGLKYAGHEKSTELIKARIEAFDGMVKTANDEACGLFVICGDLFEKTTGIAKKDIKAIIESLTRFNGIVAVLPGNHDYYDSEVKVWKDFEDVMSGADNVMLLKEYKPYSLEIGDDSVILYPAFCASLHSNPGENNLGWIKEQNITADGAYHIGVAHGAVEGETMDNEGQYFLMTRSELESIPVDAWLIGHTHVPFPRNLSEDKYTEGEWIFNPGTHVQTDVNCNTDGLCFIVEIDENKTVRAKKVHSGNICFRRKNIDLFPDEAENILKRELAEIDEVTVADIILSGTVTSEEYYDIQNIFERTLPDFLESNLKYDSLSKLITKELVEAEFPETSLSAKLLSALLDEPKEAQLAYDLLKSIKEG